MSQKISHVDELAHLVAGTNGFLAVGHLFSLDNTQTGNNNEQVRGIICSFIYSVMNLTFIFLHNLGPNCFISPALCDALSNLSAFGSPALS